MRTADMDEVRLLLAGDLMTGRGVDQVLPHAGDPRLQEHWVRDARDYVLLAERVNGKVPAPVQPDYLWGDALAEMDRRTCHLRIANLETAVTVADAAWPGKGIHYRMHPRNVGCLTVAKLDGCSLANNHVLDWGRAGLDETLASLAVAGVRTAGAGADGAAAWAPAVLPLPGGRRLLLFACATASSGAPAEWAASPTCSGIAWLPDVDAETAGQFAREVMARRRPGDLVLVSIHWGGNWGLSIPPRHRQFARALIDAGAADAVHGHSSHHPLPIEVYRGKPILYGCGDLLNDYEGIGDYGSLRNDLGCLYFAALGPDGGLRSLEILPLQRCRFRLRPADTRGRHWLRDALESDAACGTRVEAPAEGGFWLRWGESDAA